MEHDAGQAKPMIQRARTVASGFADVGLSHAEELLRRMSPEGREQARREREAKARRQKRLLIRLAIAAIASLLAWALLAVIVAPGVALAVVSALMLFLTMMIILRAAPRSPGREALVEARLAGLGDEAVVWLAAQRRGLPLPALHITDSLCRRLEVLTPHLGRLDPRSPAAAAIHKLIAVELPDLVDGWRHVPVSMRRVPHADGRSPEDQLTNGLQLIDAELARAGEHLGHGGMDIIAVQNRYLELKYSEKDRL